MHSNNYINTADVLLTEQVYLAKGNTTILNGATLRLSRGSVTGLLGRNGAGKSTLLRVIFGTEHCNEADIFVNGIKSQRLYTRAGLVSYLPQASFLPPFTRVSKVFSDFGVPEEVVLDVVPELADMLQHRIMELSGGWERMISALAILLTNSRFTLLDEPFSQLMPLHVERLQQLIKSCSRHKGIVLTDHVYRPLLAVSDHLYLMRDGKSIYIRDEEDLVTHGYLSTLTC